MNRGGYVGLGYHAPQSTFTLGNHTNNNDWQSRVSRVFVGNLNPREVSDRWQIYHRFVKYGHIPAVSVHKGFAFVQFTNEVDARNAVREEDGALFGSQKMDLCVSTEREKVNKGNSFKNDSDFDTGYQGTQAKKRRFQDNTLLDKKSGDEPSTWICSTCKHAAISAWELMKHCAAIHQNQIYDLNGGTADGE